MADQNVPLLPGQIPIPNAQGALNQADTMAAISDTLIRLKSIMETQGAGSMITLYTGEPKKYSEWTKQIEKFAILANLEPGSMKLIAYQTAQGAVSDYIKRRITSATNRDETWGEFKANLATKFAEITDPQYAFTRLKSERQKVGETVIIFAERLINLAQDAFLNHNINNDLVDQQLIGFFTDGLSCDALKWKLIRANPRTLQAAIDLALAEENLRRRFDLRVGRTYDNPGLPSRDLNPRDPRLRRRIEPMDTLPPNNSNNEPMIVDHSRPLRPCQKCGAPHLRSENCSIRPRIVNAVRQNEERPPIRCYFCDKVGHVRADCYLLNRNRDSPTSPSHRQVSFSGHARSDRDMYPREEPNRSDGSRHYNNPPLRSNRDMYSREGTASSNRDRAPYNGPSRPSMIRPNRPLN